MPPNQPHFQLPIFADLFYAVVIGFALSKVNFDGGLTYFFWLFFLFAAVLEDWYLYYKSVQPSIVQNQKYTFHSILVEFLILFFWSMAFHALLQESEKVLLFFACFMGVKFYAGANYYRKQRQLLTKPAAREFLYLIPVLVCGSLYAVSIMGQEVSEVMKVTFAFSWTISVGLWWYLFDDS